MSSWASAQEVGKFIRKVDIPPYPSNEWVWWHLEAMRLCGNLESPSHQANIQRLVVLLIVGIYP